MLKFYHVYGEGQDAYCIESVRMLDVSGYEYVLTFLDKSPNMARLVSKKYDVQTFPLIVECDINGSEQVLGSYADLKAALEYSDDCQDCKEG
ncbi:MAG TPA: hypothetical protein EYN67_04085 [Flavobacteriales bacterium]|jgi:hypothetical protein|nr:hypothetical protein [Flavobacteriales bacterium]